ncbi:hypothetical protein YC2023_099685 [Brassica napus]
MARSIPDSAAAFVTQDSSRLLYQNLISNLSLVSCVSIFFNYPDLKKSNENVGTGGESFLRDENGNESQAPPSSMPTYCDAPLPDDEAQRRAVFDWVERKLVVVVEVEPSKKKKRKRGGVGEKSRDTTA